jgi:hypothetical protein
LITTATLPDQPIEAAPPHSRLTDVRKPVTEEDAKEVLGPEITVVIIGIPYHRAP